MLRRKGITRVRPLVGGIDAWRELAYPIEMDDSKVGIVVTAEIHT